MTALAFTTRYAFVSGPEAASLASVTFDSGRSVSLDGGPHPGSFWLRKADARAVTCSHTCTSHPYTWAYAVRLQTPLRPATAATVPHTPTQTLLGSRPPGSDLSSDILRVSVYPVGLLHSKKALSCDAPMRRQRQVAGLDPAVVLEALLLRRQPLQIGLLLLQFLRSGGSAPDALASRAHDAGPLERQELERAPDVEDLAAGRALDQTTMSRAQALPIAHSQHNVCSPEPAGPHRDGADPSRADLENALAGKVICDGGGSVTTAM